MIGIGSAQQEFLNDREWLRKQLAHIQYQKFNLHRAVLNSRPVFGIDAYNHKAIEGEQGDDYTGSQ